MNRRRPAAVAAPLLLALGFAAPFAVAASPPSAEAIRLRNQGIAELENEQPTLAEETFRKLTAIAPRDPLPWADLAIAALRQQKFDDATAAIGKALALAPEAPELLAIAAENQQWSGDSVTALATYTRAADAAPDDPGIQFALYRLAGTLGDTPAARAAAGRALERLARLRPENVVVMLERGLDARERGDRAEATAAFLRLRELIWQAPPAAAALVDQILAALEANDLAAARVPSLRLGNLLKVTAMHRESQRELAPGIQGVPITRFRDEPPPADFGPPVPVRYAGSRLGDSGATPHGLTVADLDRDERPDVAVLAGAGTARRLVLHRAAQGWRPDAGHPAAGIEALLAVDLDNDGAPELVGVGPGAARVWRWTAAGEASDAAEAFGLAGARAAATAALDFDIEGDLDVLTGGENGLELWLNALDGPLTPVGADALPRLALGPVRAMLATDLDRDGDQDVLIVHGGGLAWLDNRRQGELADRTEEGGLAGLGGVRAVASGDLDDDGLPDLVVAGRGVRFLHNVGGRFEPWQPAGGLATPVEFSAVELLDADNDGRLDLALAGEGALAVAARRADRFEFLNLDGAPRGAAALASADLDGDGDLDLLAAGADGLYRLDNVGGSANGWLAVRLRGLQKGNSKNNVLGLGSTVEIRTGAAYQFREVTGEVTHFGLGRLDRAEVMRVVWTNGVPQNRFDVASAERIVEEQVLKGSCPFLYAWDGEAIRFVTDLLWGAPAGLPLGGGAWAGADPQELVVVTGAEPDAHGIYELRITEELWEAAFFDHVRLWVVDHPAEVEVASNLRVLPHPVADRVLGTREPRPLAAAWDAAGVERTERVARRDDVYADGWRESAYQGVADGVWSFTLDLGAAPAAPIRLLLDGWIFPSDASLNIALAQRGYRPVGPRLEVETADGWQPLVPQMGMPAGKTKTMVIDTPALPAGAHRLRIVSTLWLSWDRIAWSLAPADDEPVVVAKLAPAVAELRYRGFSAPVRLAPNAPHGFDYARVSTDSPWLPFPGRYTRYGDVRELLELPDDRSVILAAGDEMRLAFDASALPPPAAGAVRTLFLESHGWDKDADRNTWEAAGVEPLPFRAMSGYPYGPGESFPDTPLTRDYRERWLTRVVP